jgi:general secretion pathway protein L
MNEFLVIRLESASADAASWVVADQTGALLGPPATGALAEAAAAATSRQVIVLVPALEVLRTRADVPVKGGKLLQILPFALEEQLAEDVEELHFAAGQRDADGRVPVAVVRRSLIEGWLQRLSAVGLSPNRLYSEGDALGAVPNTVTLLLQPECAVLAEADGSVTAVDADGIDGFLDLWLARRAAEADAPPLHLVVYGAPGVLAGLEPTWEKLRPAFESIDLRTLADGVLPRLAAQIVTSPGVNLLQGAFARRSSLAAYWPVWRVAAALLATLAMLTLAVQFLELRRMQREIAALDADIDQAFHFVFPDAGPVQDPRAQLSSRLQKLGEGRGGGGHEFLDTLRVVSQALGGSGAARLEAINYRAGTLELRVRAPNVEALDQIQQRVASSGSLKAQIQSANAAGNEVVGRLQITRAGG